MSDLIHCITNPISMMQCANAILALSCKPIMAEHPLEIRDITATASALLLNFGHISDEKMESMRISFETAVDNGIPVVIDVVGSSCSTLRRNFLFELLEKRKEEKTDCILIKGNYSEIKALYDETYRGKGIDSDPGIPAEYMAEKAEDLARRLRIIILASGEKDVVSDGEKTVYICNGTPEMADITGTGCMQGAVCACFLAKEKNMESVVRACAFFGTAGEKACREAVRQGGRVGSGSYLTALMDALSLLDMEDAEKNMRTEDARNG